LSHTAGGNGAQYAVLDTRDHSVTYRTSSPDAGTRSHAITPTLDGETLYIAHDTGNRVTSVNAESGALNFTLLNIPRAEETAASRSGEVLWVSARGGNAVMRVDLTSNPVAVGDPIPVGSQPESMMLTPNEGTLVVSLRGSPASLSFVDTLALAAFPPVRIGPEDTSLGDLAVMTQRPLRLCHLRQQHPRHRRHRRGRCAHAGAHRPLAISNRRTSARHLVLDEDAPRSR
jgi:DNA-binding beta-propeller fold protein YncE